MIISRTRSTSLAQVFTEEDVAHILLPRKGVVNSYVIDVRFLSHCRTWC